MDIAPLVTFRVLFGLAMTYAIVRFVLKGWVDQLYLQPTFHFKYFGFEWVEVPPGNMLYVVFGVLACASIFVALGLFYRVAIALFFLGFTYIELLDITTYLNHYYFISLVSFLLCFVPANRCMALDNLLWPHYGRSMVPAWAIAMFKWQLGIVYFFAGLAKLNPDWLFRAQPLATWLPPRVNLPIIGWIFKYKASAYVFSWAGAIYDLLVPFFLYRRQTVVWAYLAVVGFHVITGALFPIGVFPLVMMLLTTVFFPATWHRKFWDAVAARFRKVFRTHQLRELVGRGLWRPRYYPAVAIFMVIYFIIQLLMPLRYLSYDGNLFWHEQGFRFSWRVMLMEKEGTAQFTVREPKTNRTWEVNNALYLTPLQEKMMATQPDLLLQFAHFIDNEYRQRGIENPTVTVDAQVSLNGRRIRSFVKEGVDLSTVNDGFGKRWWLTDF